MDRAGLVGGDGAVHHGFLDIAYLRSLPGMTLLAPIDEPTLKLALDFMAGHDEGPSACRYPRESVATPPAQEQPPAFEMGKANLLATGSDNAVLAYGTMAYQALTARKELESQGYSVAVYDARFAKPVDTGLIRTLVEAGTAVLTVEDHAVMGGFGTCVLEAAHEMGLATTGIHRMGLPDRYIYQGSRSGQLAEAELDAAAIARRVRAILDDRRPEVRQATVSPTVTTRAKPVGRAAR
jgi:1-deoxy-D-xylulose-5-phosphate synthase